jgi:hypothetical protein
MDTIQKLLFSLRCTQHNGRKKLEDVRLNCSMSEGKYNEGKGRDEDDRSRHDVMEIVQEFCMSDEFEKEFEMFAKEHCGVFMKSLEFSVHSNEHPIEFHNVYLLYLKKFEGMIEEFITKVNYL